jgi:Uma2 family endonuclease
MVLEKTRTYTRAEFAMILEDPEHADKILELVEGEIIEKMPTNPYCSALVLRLAMRIGNHVDLHDVGYVTGADGGYDISDKDSFAPDVAFISKARQPELPRRGYNPIPPDLAVEVKSPTDSKREMRKKAEKYIAFGTKLVWLVFPNEQVVEVYEGSEDVKTLGLDDTLNGGTVLPGFELPVREIFK